MNIEILIPIIVTAILTSLCSLAIQLILNNRSRDIEVLKERLTNVYVPFYIISNKRNILPDCLESSYLLLKDFQFLMDKLHLLESETQAYMLSISTKIKIDGKSYLDSNFFVDYAILESFVFHEYQKICKTLKYPVPKFNS